MNLKFIQKLKKIDLKHFIKENRKPKIKKQEIIIICMILMIGITFFSGVSLGKAVYNTNIKNNTQIAKPVLEVEKDSEIIITEDNKKGEYKNKSSFSYFTIFFKSN